MSFPSRPPPAIVPAGMPYGMSSAMMPPTIIPAGMPPSMSQPPPGARSASFRGPPPTIGSRPQMYNNSNNHHHHDKRDRGDHHDRRGGGVQVPNAAPTMDGPVITVFIGNISDRAPDPMIKKILASCGTVINWKRVSTFGFCEYDGAVAGARAVRLLHDLEIDGKKLVAKVDAKNKALLDNYKDESNGAVSEQSEKLGDDDSMDLITRILDEFSDDLMGPEPADDFGVPRKEKKQLQSANIEEGKRDIISKEIGKFRKYTEEEEIKKEKEKERKKAKEEKKESGEVAQSHFAEHKLSY